MFTSESRGLQSRGTEQVEKKPSLLSKKSVQKSVVITKDIQAAAEKAIREMGEKRAGSLMIIGAIKPLSFSNEEGAQSLDDITVHTVITYKYKVEKPSPKVGNYTSELINVPLGYLLYGDRSSGRRPVTTPQMLDNKSEELDVKEKKKLTELARKMKTGEQDNVNKELEVIANERRRFAKERIAKIDENSTDVEIATAIKEVSKAAELSDSPEDDTLMEQIAKKQQKKLEESESVTTQQQI